MTAIVHQISRPVWPWNRLKKTRELCIYWPPREIHRPSTCFNIVLASIFYIQEELATVSPPTQAAPFLDNVDPSICKICAHRQNPPFQNRNKTTGTLVNFTPHSEEEGKALDNHGRCERKNFSGNFPESFRTRMQDSWACFFTEQEQQERERKAGSRSKQERWEWTNRGAIIPRKGIASWVKSGGSLGQDPPKRGEPSATQFNLLILATSVNRPQELYQWQFFQELEWGGEWTNRMAIIPRKGIAVWGKCGGTLGHDLPQRGEPTAIQSNLNPFDALNFSGRRDQEEDSKGDPQRDPVEEIKPTKTVNRPRESRGRDLVGVLYVYGPYLGKTFSCK